MICIDGASGRPENLTRKVLGRKRIGVKEGGITPDQLLAKIMAAILANITKSVADADASLPAEATTDGPPPTDRFSCPARATSPPP